MRKTTQKIMSEHTSVIIVLLVLVALIIGYFFGAKANQAKYTKFLESFRILRSPGERDSLINPLIGSSSNPATDIGFYVDVKEEIVAFLESEKKNKNLEEYSFYVRDLNSGFWFGENESATYFPASLFKLPVAIAVYAQVEDDATFLKRQVIYTQDLSVVDSGDPQTSQTVLVVGRVYTIEQLVEIMLVQSDNAAKDALLANLDVKYLQKIFNIAHLVDPTKTSTYTVSTREYSLFLRVLYGASFLNEEHSELLLKMLSSSTFTEGLVAGVPKGITVAHKYGVFQESTIKDGTETVFQLLHDCGIVYHPDHPYAVCIMTKGKNEKTVTSVISRVSSILYKHANEGGY